MPINGAEAKAPSGRSKREELVATVRSDEDEIGGVLRVGSIPLVVLRQLIDWPEDQVRLFPDQTRSAVSASEKRTVRLRELVATARSASATSLSPANAGGRAPYGSRWACSTAVAVKAGCPFGPIETGLRADCQRRCGLRRIARSSADHVGCDPAGWQARLFRAGGISMRAFRRRLEMVELNLAGARRAGSGLPARAGLVGLVVVVFGGGLLLALGGAAGAAHERDARAGSVSTSTETATTPRAGKSGPQAATIAPALPGVSLGWVYGTFYPNPNNNSGFDFSQLSQPAFSQRFQLLYFNPYDVYQPAACTNSPGVNDVTRPFTEVTQSPDGTCGTVPAQGNGFQAGVGSLNTFEATFTAELTVAVAGQYTFYFRTDDGWIMGAGPKIGGTAQPTFVSGDLSSAPPATPQKSYPVVGAYNQAPLGTLRHTTVNFPAAGTYPIEVDYSECCGGGLVLMFVNSNFAPIGGVAPPEQTYGSCRAGRYTTPTVVAQNPTGCLSDPVNTLTGAYMNSVVDASLPGIDVPFRFARSYTSADTSSGELGVGWTDSYASSLAVQANGDVVLRAADGQQVRYTLQPDGSFVGAPGALATLTKLSDHYELLRRDQQVDRYALQGRLLSERGRNGQGVTLAYDPNGLLQTVTDSAQRVISFTHTGGLLTKLSLPDGRSVSYGYTSGQLTSVTDLRGGITRYGDDGRVTQELDGLSNPTTFAWDAATQTATVTDARQNAWKDVYSNNVLVQRIDPLGNTTRYGYDSAGNLTSITTPLGNKTTLGYDGAGRLTSLVEPRGNVSGANPANFTWKYGYDNSDDLTSQTDPLGNLTQIAYDPAGNLSIRTEAKTHKTSYDYDANNRLITVTASDGASKTRYGFDEVGNLKTRTDANNHMTSYGYDAANRLTSVLTPRNEQWTYGYNANGDVTSLVDANGNASATAGDGTTTFGYDNRDRLTSVCFKSKCPSPNDPFIRWTYDPVGNRLSEARPGNTTNYSYNADDELTAAGTTSYGYDANGNETAAGSRSFGYDLSNRLASTVNAGTTTTYGYDGDGKRLKMVSGATTTNYLWDINQDPPQLALERDGTGALLRRYLYGAARISMTSGGSPFYYHYDGLGSVANLTSATGVTQWTYTYEPFGTTRTQTQGAGTTPPANLMRFTGELIDTDTGLYHLRARQYDPGTGRFLSTDPAMAMTLDPSVGAYVYVQNVPTMLVDPTGFLCFSFHCGWENTKAIGRAAVNVVSNPNTATGVGGGAALCAVTGIESLGTTCLVLGAVAVVSEISSSARENLAGGCDRNVGRFFGDAALSLGTLGGGSAAKRLYPRVMDAGHVRNANRLTEPALWLGGIAAHAGETGCSSK